MWPARGQPVALGEPDQRAGTDSCAPLNIAWQIIQLNTMPSATRISPGAALAHENSGGCGTASMPSPSGSPIDDSVQCSNQCRLTAGALR